MKTTVTLTSRGVVTLPAKLRQALGLQADDQLIAETTPAGLLLRTAVTIAVEPYLPEREREFDAAEAELAALLAREPQAPALRETRRQIAVGDAGVPGRHLIHDDRGDSRPSSISSGGGSCTKASTT